MQLPTENKELIQALSAGNRIAFNELFDIYSGKVYRFAFSYLKNKSDSEELVQDVFLKIWERRQFIQEQYSFKAYLFTITFNAIKKTFQRRSRQYRYLDSLIFEEQDSTTGDQIDFESTKNIIFKTIQSLSPQRREVFIKNRIDGLSIKEIAADLGTSPKTVEKQLGEASKQVKAALTRLGLAPLLFFILFLS